MALLIFMVATPLLADTEYYHRVFFDNSITSDSYFYSSGKATAPSLLTLLDGRLPVETHTFITPPNALRLEWSSQAGGNWMAEIDVVKFRNRDIHFQGDTLSLWCFAPQLILASDLPLVRIADTSRGFSAPVRLGEFTGAMRARQWAHVKIPLDAFISASIHSLDANRLQSLIFSQASPDAAQHSLIIDQITIESSHHAATPSSLPAPQNVRANGYELHIDVSWQPVDSRNLEYYLIYRSTDGINYRPIGIQEPGLQRYADFLGRSNQTAYYKVAAASFSSGHVSQLSAPTSASTRLLSDDQLLSMLQEECFRYYWESAGPHSGMAHENIPGDDGIITTGASGFGIMALIVGINRGFITREQGIERLNKIVSFLGNAPRYHGAWSHFMDDSTGKSLPVFDMFDNGGDIVETAFLMEGLLTARQYLNQSNDEERLLYHRISRLWETVEWDWYRRSSQSPTLYWHWSPDWSWYLNHRLTGFNEVMIVYLLAIASPTHSVPASLYYTGWADGSVVPGHVRGEEGSDSKNNEFIDGKTHYGIKLDVGSRTGNPLFFAHYSYMGFDPRGIRDPFTNYFDNNRNLALINRAYCIANPGHHKGYGLDSWASLPAMVRMVIRRMRPMRTTTLAQ